ncbi:hypothetical protein NQ314_016227 [Rhamnusium bicolor]|uniref:C2H2-type domain-containing protein n=1 Tax=Rhamnusium bicolor TaxID=1586634 RepID=A0AAV8WWR0_9CUCU|nr:hypothetical protein NQ314_016227 [Rhamnusium bicolor]
MKVQVLKAKAGEGAKMENRNKSVKYVCKICEKTFTVKSNLKRHVLKVHVDSMSTASQKFICYHCSKAYANKYNLIRHVYKCNNSGNRRQRCSKEVKCILCNKYTGLKINLLKHYSLDHDINITTQNLQFASFLEFEAWKDQIEEDTVLKYVRHDSIKSNDRNIYYYRCHRDGFYQSKGKHTRHLKLKGTNKIDGYCPSKIDTTIINTTGEVHVLFLRTHVGHTMDLGKIPLKKIRYKTFSF